MKFSKLLPWRMLLQRAAHRYGFIDPLLFLARMRRFSQPSDVAEPIELLRAGVSFHARGLLNTRAIQTNLDWVWPYWVECQFNPASPSFVPRAFSFSHVNLTHRNWTAAAQPDVAVYPIVDPRGLVTPLYDGWSLDFWLIGSDGTRLLPSKLERVEQTLAMDDELAVVTKASADGLALNSRAAVRFNAGKPELQVELTAQSEQAAQLVVAVRPYNPEGIQFVESASFTDRCLTVNENAEIGFSDEPGAVHFSEYERGDVLHHLDDDAALDASCDVGMLTAAVQFDLESGHRTVRVSVPLAAEAERERATVGTNSWGQVLGPAASLSVPDALYQFLYDAALRTTTLLSAGQIVPGPYTYKRFWFRDACLMMNALLAVNLPDRVARAFPTFIAQQKRDGYFQSQEGEWDSNGQVLWICNRYELLTGERLDGDLLKSLARAVRWFRQKRVRAPGTPHDGLLPAGFSAEHFGPNDYYYWDDYWAVAGLQGAEQIFQRHGDSSTADYCRQEAATMAEAIARSLDAIPARRRKGGIPASPYRRLDSGAIGSMVADYPLQLVAQGDSALLSTGEHLMQHCFHDGAFFQDMIHSGQNIYLTLDIAQTLLRHGDSRYRNLLDRVAALASSTGQWPEAVHPRTGGGCMGDGQHGWAAAEWLMMIRNLFVREEGDHLVIGTGILPRWLEKDEALHFGPTLTPFGAVSVAISESPRQVSVEGQWFGDPPRMTVNVPGYRRFDLDAAEPRQALVTS
ncbi:MAG: hypothetical protein WD078_11765 [Woeseia sp.]